MKNVLVGVGVVVAVVVGMYVGPGVATQASLEQVGSALPNCNCDDQSSYDCKIWNKNPDCSGSNTVGSDSWWITDDEYYSVKNQNTRCTDPDCARTDHEYQFTSNCTQKKS